MGDLEQALKDDSLTETQKEVLETADRNPDMKQTEIADVVGCSDSTVSRTFDEYGDPREDSGGNGLLFLILAALLLGVLFVASGGGGGDSAESAVGMLVWFLTL